WQLFLLVIEFADFLCCSEQARVARAIEGPILLQIWLYKLRRHAGKRHPPYGGVRGVPSRGSRRTLRKPREMPLAAALGNPQPPSRAAFPPIPRRTPRDCRSARRLGPHAQSPRSEALDIARGPAMLPIG